MSALSKSAVLSAPNFSPAMVVTVMPKPLELPPASLEESLRRNLNLLASPSCPCTRCKITSILPAPSFGGRVKSPGCNFQVFQKPGLQGHSDRRRVHLRDAHGISKPPSLRGARELASRHNRLSKQIDSCDIGWACCFANLQSKGWWPGAHSIAEAKPSAWREYKSKENTYWRPLHRCYKCDRLVSRSELTSSPCPNADAPLAPKVASRIWKECRTAARASLAQDKKARLKERSLPSSPCCSLGPQFGRANSRSSG